MHWEIQLIGDITDLRMLSESMCGGDISVCEQDGEYVLRSKELDRLQDIDETRDRAKEVVTSISGTARILLGAHKPIRIGGNINQIRDDGTRNTFVQGEPGVAHARGLPGSISITRNDATVERHLPADPVEDWLKVAGKDSDVARALRLRDAGELTWTDLYRIYEVIEGDVGDKLAIVKLGWAKDRDIKNFKDTANNPAAAGDQARHGWHKKLPSKNPMSLRQAKGFIDTIFKAWIKNKARSSPQCPNSSKEV